MLNAWIFSSFTVYTGVWQCLLMHYSLRLTVVWLYFLCICISWSLLRLAVKVEALIRNAIYLLLGFFSRPTQFFTKLKKNVCRIRWIKKGKTIMFNIWKSINKIKFEQVLKEGIFLWFVFNLFGYGGRGRMMALLLHSILICAKLCFFFQRILLEKVL